MGTDSGKASIVCRLEGVTRALQGCTNAIKGCIGVMQV